MRLARIAPLFAALTLSAAVNAQPDSLVADPNDNCVCPAQDLKSRAKDSHVFIGKVTKRVDEPKFDGEKMPAKYEYIFEVSKWFKGELAGPVVVRTFSTTCSTSFEIGATYAVFANTNQARQLTASHCSGNRIATPEVTSALEKVFNEAAAASGGSGDRKGNGSNSNNSNGDGDGKGDGKGDGDGGGKGDGGGRSADSKSKLPYIIGGALFALVAIALIVRRKN